MMFGYNPAYIPMTSTQCGGWYLFLHVLQELKRKRPQARMVGSLRSACDLDGRPLLSDFKYESSTV